MSKRREPHVVKQGETEHIHPQISRTTYGDLMSKQTEVSITIPPLGITDADFFEVLDDKAFKGEHKVTSWADIQALVGFHNFERAKDLYPKQQGHHGPVQRPERFSEEAFKFRAYQAIAQALEAIEGLSDEHKETVLNIVAPRFFSAGMAVAEARLRENHYDDVAVRRRVRKGLRQWSAAEAEKKEEKLAEAMKSMMSYIERGSSISNAARLSHEKDGHGASVDANRRLYYRRGGRIKL